MKNKTEFTHCKICLPCQKVYNFIDVTGVQQPLVLTVIPPQITGRKITTKKKKKQQRKEKGGSGASGYSLFLFPGFKRPPERLVNITVSKWLPNFVS